jgi:hypothetical protein
MRGGGDTGAKTFKGYCAKRAQITQDVVGLAGAKKDRGGATASVLKAELYSSVRNLLRCFTSHLCLLWLMLIDNRAASGVHNAEMKWSNHSRLDTYGVTLSGWPANIPKQNPSTLSVSQMRALLDLLEDGRLHFVKEGGAGTTARVDRETEDFSWACEDDQTQVNISLTVVGD